MEAVGAVDIFSDLPRQPSRASSRARRRVRSKPHGTRPPGSSPAAVKADPCPALLGHTPTVLPHRPSRQALRLGAPRPAGVLGAISSPPHTIIPCHRTALKSSNGEHETAVRLLVCFVRNSGRSLQKWRQEYLRKRLTFLACLLCLETVFLCDQGRNMPQTVSASYMSGLSTA